MGFALLAGLGAGAAHAQSGEAASPAEFTLTQRGVPAEASAANAVLARDLAHAAARRIAFDRMLAEAGARPVALSDEQLERAVASLVIEQERISPNRYSGMLTVNFSGARLRGTLGARMPGSGPPAASASPAEGATTAAPAGPVVGMIEVVATYRTLAEWLELRRRLGGAGPVASVAVTGLAVDAARLRVGLRQPLEAAVGELAGLGVTLAQGAGGFRVHLTGGG